MINITSILEKYGLAVPADKKADFEKDVAANYKTVAEFDKKVGNLESERDAWKQKATTADETLKGFEGVDVKDLQAQIDAYKQKAADAEADFKKQIADRDFNDALRAELASVEFTSSAAKKSIEASIRGAGLTLREGKILGIGDILAQLKESDAGAFVDKKKQELDEKKATVTTTISGNTGGDKPMTKDEIMAIKDRDERRAAIAANIKLFEK